MVTVGPDFERLTTFVLGDADDRDVGGGGREATVAVSMALSRYGAVKPGYSGTLINGNLSFRAYSRSFARKIRDLSCCGLRYFRSLDILRA
jgi:hypothetical protein